MPPLLCAVVEEALGAENDISVVSRNADGEELEKLGVTAIDVIVTSAEREDLMSPLRERLGLTFSVPLVAIRADGSRLEVLEQWDSRDPGLRNLVGVIRKAVMQSQVPLLEKPCNK